MPKCYLKRFDKKLIGVSELLISAGWSPISTLYNLINFIQFRRKDNTSVFEQSQSVEFIKRFKYLIFSIQFFFAFHATYTMAFFGCDYQGRLHIITAIKARYNGFFSLVIIGILVWLFDKIHLVFAKLFKWSWCLLSCKRVSSRCLGSLTFPLNGTNRCRKLMDHINHRQR